MNRVRIFAPLLAAAILLPLASSLTAEQRVEFKVPFAFSVSDRVLPAGEYRIDRDGPFLHIENRDNHQIVILIARPGDNSKDGRIFLSFDQVNGTLFLRQLVDPNPTRSVNIAASKTEKQARGGD
jgi:hypothetical protein